jgi:hypothetical protein
MEVVINPQKGVAPMELEKLIIATYLCIDEKYQAITSTCALRRGGFAPALTDSEVITMEIIGEMQGKNGDRAIWRYFIEHWKDWFPNLGAYKTFAKQCANLVWVKQVIMKELFSAKDTIHSIDGVPMPICRRVRAYRSKVMKGIAAYGYCASKEEKYYGLRGHAVINMCGYIVSFIVTPANADERSVFDDLMGKIRGLVIGDKGFIGENLNNALRDEGIDLQTPLRDNMKENRPKGAIKMLMRARKPIETAFSVLIDSFNLLKIKAHDLWHYTNKLTRKLLAYNFHIMMQQKS